MDNIIVILISVTIFTDGVEQLQTMACSPTETKLQSNWQLDLYQLVK